MSQLLAISRRELQAYLLSPAGYVILAVFVAFTAILYFMTGSLLGAGLNQGAPASLRLFFAVGVWVFLFVAPAISMRTVSEELRSGTFEMLMTSPVTEAQVVLGKFLGSVGYLLVMLLPTLVYVVVLEIYGRPDYGEILCGYLGLVLAGSAFLATGLLVSCLTASQVVAYLVTLFFWLILLLLSKGLPAVSGMIGELAAASSDRAFVDTIATLAERGAIVMRELDPHERIRGFSIGLLDTRNVVYFLSFIAVALLAATKALEARRWR